MEIIFVTGASGSGKTTLLKRLNERQGSEIDFYYFDSTGVPSSDEMVEKYGSGEEWQRQMTLVWVDKILANSKKDIAVLDGQMKLAFITTACISKGFESYRIILIDCADNIRKQRLLERGQPALANDDMMNWAKYLRDEAYQIGANILDTSKQAEAESEELLLKLISS